MQSLPDNLLPMPDAISITVENGDNVCKTDCLIYGENTFSQLLDLVSDIIGLKKSINGYHLLINGCHPDKPNIFGPSSTLDELNLKNGDTLTFFSVLNTF
ncbi:MAG: hypothetical protein IKK24_03130 [Clostridia bacterium]|nr:hypothetical protein [Clostridia bacterium]